VTVDVTLKKFLPPEGAKINKILSKGKTYGFPLWRKNCINAIFAVTPFLIGILNAMQSIALSSDVKIYKLC